MEAITTVVDWIVNTAGVSVMMPIIIFVLAMVFRAPLGKSIRAAISVGVGFTGLNLILGLLVGALSPATQAMAERFGLALPILDLGWPVAAAISFSTPWAFLVFVLVFALNVVLIALNWTKTLDVDLWNYWSFAFVFSMIWIATNSIPLAIVGTLVYAVLTFKLADWTAPVLADYFNMPGISLPHGDTIIWAPIGFALDALWDRIPVIKDIRVEPETIQKRLGVFGEPMIVGLVIGLVLGILAWFQVPPTGDALAQILSLGISTGSFMVLMPRMIGLLMEGLMPMSESAREFMLKRFPGRELYIGLDAAILTGFPAVVSTALVMTPLTLIIAAILPGNRILPFADLAVLVFVLQWAVAPSRGNIFRGVLSGVVVFMPLVLLVATNLAPELTRMGLQVGADIPADQTVSSMVAGFKTLAWPILQLLWFVGGHQTNMGTVLLAVGYLVVYALVWWWVWKRPKALFKATEEE
jgi:PTS system galactitol-specific IIC component